MPRQIYIVVTYRDGHHHVTPLYPRELNEHSAHVTARELAEVEGRACHHVADGDRIEFAAVMSDNSIGAVQLTEAGRTLVHGEFTL